MYQDYQQPAQRKRPYILAPLLFISGENFLSRQCSPCFQIIESNLDVGSLIWRQTVREILIVQLLLVEDRVHGLQDLFVLNPIN